MRAKISTASVLAVAVSLFAAIPAWAVEYTFTDLGCPSPLWKWAYGVNESGQVVGYYMPTSGPSVRHGFLYSGGVMQDLVSLDGTSGVGYGINTSGQIVGSASGHAFLYNNGAMQDLGTLGGSYSTAYDINDHGHVVGSSQVTGDTSSHIFLYSNGAMQDLGAWNSIHVYEGVEDVSINANGQIVASYMGSSSCFEMPNGRHAFLYDNGVIHELGTLGGSYTAAYDINDLGQVVGNSTLGGPGPFGLGDGFSRAYLYSNGVMQDLGTLGGDYSRAWGINNLGEVVGDADIAGIRHAFLYSDGQMTDLNTLLPAGSGWTLDMATAINDAGQIVGMAYPDGSYRSHLFLLTPTPEPTTLLLTALAAVGILSRRRRS